MMNIKKIVNIFCLIMGIAVIVFGCVVMIGMVDNAESERGIIPLFLGGIIVLWSAVSILRNRS